MSQRALPIEVEGARRVRILSLKVDGTGTASVSGLSSNRVTLTDNGTGDYTITFDKAFAQAPQVFVTSLLDDQVVSLHSAPTTTSCRLEVRSVAACPAAADGEFDLLIIGSDCIDKY
jgi:hypothetical protein